MRRVFLLLLTIFAGLAGYILVFVFALKKPLTVGVISDYYAVKLNYLRETAGQNRIIIFAGSNGRYSHRCSYIEEHYAVKCVNLSVGSGFNHEWEFARYLPYIGPKDLLYLPIEYGNTRFDPRIDLGDEISYIVQYDHGDLWHFYSPSQSLRAVFTYDLASVLSATGEMLLQVAGVGRRVSVTTLDQQGDETAHTLQKSAAYRSYIQEMPALAVSPDDYEHGVPWYENAWIIREVRSRGAMVVGGLPTVPDDTKIPQTALTYLQEFYLTRGACFLALPNRSQYPRTDFYDTHYHLSEPYQIEHTSMLAPYLLEMLSTHACLRNSKV
jgi:hypothetical protein